MISFAQNENQAMIAEMVKKFADTNIRPHFMEWDETQHFPVEVFKKLGDLGLMGVLVPQEYGGSGFGYFEYVTAITELAKVCGSIGLSMAAHNSLCTGHIMAFGNEEQKKKYLPDIAAGKRLVAFGLTEANAGSDAAGIQTTAKLDGNEYILNGAKQWITNGGEAEIYTIIALTDRSKGARGASAFVVEKGTPGFSFGKKEKKMGIRASSTRELIFDNCRIPRENLIGREGLGFIIAMKTLDNARAGVGAQGVGLAQGAFEEALKFARQRVQFGHPIISFQAVQHMLADMAIEIEAARALVYAVARYVDSGAKDFTKESAISKVFATDLAMRVTTNAVQVMGGSGYMREYPVEKMMRDAKILQIYEGTNQIQRNVIGQELIKEAAKNKM